MIKVCQQIAALPFIIEHDFPLFLLVTRRRSQSWIIPKGWPKEGMEDHELAALEAFEEAGLGGEPATESIGYYDETKERSGFEAVEHGRIQVFPFHVQYHYIDWPEKGQRKHTWLGPEAAAKLVENKSLAAIISAFQPAH